MKEILVAGLLAAASLGVAAQSLPLVELTAGFHRIEAEVAAEEGVRMQGLMHRRVLPPHRGMLFVFPDAARHCFWMKNTLIPLSIAFLDDAGRILNIEEMEPQSEDNHCAVAPARYALEMNAGWFFQRTLRRGDRIGGLESVPPAY